MATTRGFRKEQRAVALAMGGALLTAIIVLSMAALADHAVATFASRLQFAIHADLFVIVWLAAAIANVARLRFFSEQDIAGSSAEEASGRVRMASAILQNTSEQVGLAVATHLIVASTFSRSNVLVAALVCLFAIGRLLFWGGYRYGAKGRAFGFALTFYPSVLALMASATATLLAWIG